MNAESATAAAGGAAPEFPHVRVFLQSCGRGHFHAEPIPGDASFRRYFRVYDPHKPSASCILMDASAPQERDKVARFVFVAETLKACGLKSPDIYVKDTAGGFLLLEDLGDDSFNAVLRGSAAGLAKEKELYLAATEALCQLHTFAAPAELEEYGDDVLLQEAMLLPDWYAAAVLEPEERQAFAAEYEALFRARIRALPACRPVVVLRDYHADNLMWLPGNDGVKKVGQLDFQDALIGSGAYDLVSLLEDVRRAVSPSVVRACKEAFYANLPTNEQAAFQAEYAFYNAQRNCKIIGIFARLAKRDKKVRYARMLPGVWRVLNGALEEPDNADLGDLLRRYFPSSMRAEAPESLLR